MAAEIGATASWKDEPAAKSSDVQLIFEAPIDMPTFKNHLENFNIPDGPIHIEILPDKDWLKENRKQFPPLRVGKFFIYSIHADVTPPKDTINLEIEASIAFGSGEHETTQGCLMGLEFLKRDRQFKAALDMGCGSGILAMAIARLWNIPVLACDFDPSAVITTVENAVKNNTPTVSALLSDGYEKVHQSFDLIMANILAGPLIDMAPDLERTLTPGGNAILSGMLESQATKVLKAHTDNGLVCTHRFDIKNWTTLILEKPIC